MGSLFLYIEWRTGSVTFFRCAVELAPMGECDEYRCKMGPSSCTAHDGRAMLSASAVLTGPMRLLILVWFYNVSDDVGLRCG